MGGEAMQQINHWKKNAKMARQCGVLLLLSACGSKAIDLDQALVTGSSDPTVVGKVREGVGHIAVDDERLYWTALPTRNGSNFGNWSLRSCLKQNCAASVVTYDTQLSAQDIWFGVTGGSIYWFRYVDQEGMCGTLNYCSPVPTGSMALLSSPVGGGSTRAVATTDSVLQAAFDTDSVYVSTDLGVDAIPLSGTGTPLQLVGPPSTLSTVYALAAEGDSLYWLSGVNWEYTAVAPTSLSLYRVRKDGHSAPVSLASDLEINVSHADGSVPFGLAVDANDAYWTQNVLVGSVDRCPITGCVTTPEAVVGPIRSPEALLIDGSTLYLRYEAGPYQYVLASCTLGQCTSPQPITQGPDAMCAAETEALCGVTASMVVDDQYLYVVTTDQDLQTSSAQENPVAQIRRFPK
jgi:hypothetical protein